MSIQLVVAVGARKIMSELSVSVIFAALVSGSILGLSSATNAELLRGGGKSLFFMFWNGSMFGAVFYLFCLFVVNSTATATAVFILRKYHAFPFSETEQYFFVIFWSLSAGCGKYFRYYYWKRKSGN